MNMVSIYLVSNSITGKQYIGQTRYSIAHRWWIHCNDPKGYCRYLSNAIKKYGKDNFRIEVIYTCDSLEEANLLEKYYIAYHNTLSPCGYNLLPGGNSRSHHPDTRLKMSISRRGRKMTGKAAAGVARGPRPPSVCKNISLAKKGKPNGLLGKKRPGIERPNSRKMVRAKCITTGEVQVFESVTELCKTLGIQRSNFRKVIKGERTHTGGYTFDYLN